MCPECGGLGKKMGVMTESFIDMNKSLAEGNLQVPGFASWELAMYSSSGFFDISSNSFA
jgi:Excinuclease ATPase subunit